MIIRIPRRFFDDHLDRDLPTPIPVRESARHVWLDSEDGDLGELLNDANYYSHDVDAAPPGVVLSARATVRAVRECYGLEDPPTGERAGLPVTAAEMAEDVANELGAYLGPLRTRV